MNLFGQHRQKLLEALIDAFPDKASLERMLAFELDKNLDTIAGGNSLEDIVFNLIKTAEAQGWVVDIVYAARKSNPGNSRLGAVAEELLSNQVPSTSIPQPPSNYLPKIDIERYPFDVFLAHNTQDKPQVRAIALALKQRNIKSWLDEEEIPPGRSFQDEIQAAIPVVKSAAIFIGSQGLGRWQSWELKAFISQCVENKIPVIPVLLPGVGNLPEDLVFLKQLRWVAFSNRVEDKAALDLLEWGITGEKPESSEQMAQKPGGIPPEIVLENENRNQPIPNSENPKPVNNEDNEGRQLFNLSHDRDEMFTPKTISNTQDASTKKVLSNSRRDFYSKQLDYKHQELAAIESQLQRTLSAVDKLRLNNHAEGIMKEIEELEAKLNQ